VRFFDELKRRNVFRVAGVYFIVAATMIQLIPPLVDAFDLPKWSNTFVFLMLAIGFPITILVTWAFEMTPEGLRRTEELDTHRHVVVNPARYSDYAILIGILVLCVYMGYSVQQVERPETAQAGTPVIGTVAVLPFANLSVEPEQEGVSRAITSDVRNRLTQVPGLKVIAGPASQKPAEDEDLRQIGKKLDAPVVLDGSVQRSGNRLRVMAQLVDTGRGVQLWSKTFNRDMADMLAVQDDLSQSIVDDVRKVIVPPAEAVADKDGPAGQARRLMADGQGKLNQRTADALSAAVTAFEQAIVRDPNSARAHAALAEALLLQGKGWETYGEVPLADAVARARPFAAKAVALGPQLAEAQAVSGLVALAAGDADAAVGKLKKAVERKPDLAKARLWLYQAYAASGRLGEGIAQLKRAYELDPDSLAIGLNMSRLLAISDQRLEADALLDRLERLYPGNENLLAARGARLADDWRPVDAIQVLQRASKADPSDAKVRLMLGVAYLDLGASGEAEQWLDAGKELVLLAQGKPQDALAEARRRFAADPGDPERVFALADAEAAAGRPQAAVNLLAPFEDASKDGAGPLYGRSPMAMPALTLAGARIAQGDAEGARPLLDGARAWLKRQRDLGFDHPQYAYLEARIAALEGRPDEAMASLRRAVARRFAGVSVVGWDPALASLRELPEYRALVADLDTDRGQRRARLKDMGLLASL
jgi:TolB-like protein/thioredoxin-like negative regulator of GroEL